MCGISYGAVGGNIAYLPKLEDVVVYQGATATFSFYVNTTGSVSAPRCGIRALAAFVWAAHGFAGEQSRAASNRDAHANPMAACAKSSRGEKRFLSPCELALLICQCFLEVSLMFLFYSLLLSLSLLPFSPRSWLSAQSPP